MHRGTCSSLVYCLQARMLCADRDICLGRLCGTSQMADNFVDHNVCNYSIECKLYILHHRRWMSMFANLHSGNPVRLQSFAIIYMPLSRVNIPLYSSWCSGPSQIPLAAAAFHVPLPSVPSAAFSLESRRNQSPPQSPQCLMKVSRSP